MSIKSTKTISRDDAIHIIFIEIARMDNRTLERLLDNLADSDACQLISRFDNFIVEG